MAEMERAERDLWARYRQQKADRQHDRLFAVFAGMRIIGVARCTRHPDGLEVDSLFVLEDYRLKGYARSVMRLLIEECGRQETLYMYTNTELVDFYASLGFRVIQKTDMPASLRDRPTHITGEPRGTGTCPMKRDPGFLAPAVPA